MDVDVFLTPNAIQADLLNAVAVVIDALRMTSVAAIAMENGCAGLMPVAGVQEAMDVARESGALLGGERNALRINGFDFSNSPDEYTREKIQGRRLVMTTTNGTRAILAASAAKRVLLGAFVNAKAVAEAVRHADKLVIICAGTYGAFTMEDALAAGSILARMAACGIEMTLKDGALAARMLYQGAGGDMHAALKKTAHYQRLETLGLAKDLDFCLREDILRVAPERGRDGWFA